jgi:hypothetical protein
MTEQQLTQALLDFQSVEATPLWRPDPGHLRDLAEQVRSAFSGARLDQGFAGRLREAIFVGLSRLDALPRDDPFWNGTNRRPTLHKISDLAGQVLERGPKEEWACWAWAATDLLCWGNDFGLAGWRGLHELGLLNGAWPVLAAFHVWGRLGHVPGPLATWLQEAGVGVQARNALEAFEASHPDWVHPPQPQGRAGGPPGGLRGQPPGLGAGGRPRLPGGGGPCVADLERRPGREAGQGGATGGGLA